MKKATIVVILLATFVSEPSRADENSEFGALLKQWSTKDAASVAAVNEDGTIVFGNILELNGAVSGGNQVDPCDANKLTAALCNPTPAPATPDPPMPSLGPCPLGMCGPGVGMGGNFDLGSGAPLSELLKKVDPSAPIK